MRNLTRLLAVPALPAALLAGCFGDVPSMNTWVDSDATAPVIAVYLGSHPGAVMEVVAYRVDPGSVIRQGGVVVDSSDNSGELRIYSLNCTLLDQRVLAAGSYRVHIDDGGHIQVGSAGFPTPTAPDVLPLATTTCGNESS